MQNMTLHAHAQSTNDSSGPGLKGIVSRDGVLTEAILA
jgi:hypothetical protein